MFYKFFIIMQIILAITCASVTAVAAEPPGCVARVSEFVQITSSQLDAGEQVFEAFHIRRNGKTEWARWNSSGQLLGHAESRNRDTDDGTFNRILSLPSVLNPPQLPEDNGAVGRWAFRIDIATLSRSGVHMVSMAQVPDDLAVLIDELRRGMISRPVQAGWYIWTQPYPSTSDVDIDLTEDKCSSMVAKALSKAIETNRLIVPVGDNIQAFISGEHANRTAFQAKLPTGGLRFGILSAK